MIQPIPLAQTASTVQPEALDPLTMAVGIVVSLLLVVVVDRLLRRRGRHTRHSYLAEAMVGVPEIMEITSPEREGAIRELVRFASRMIRTLDEATILKAVLKRESEMSTGLVHGIAAPHARFHELDRSFVLYGRSTRGIPWNCVDDKPAKLIFLLLSPEDDPQDQLHMLAEIGRCADDPECLDLLRTADDCRTITRAIEHKAKDHHPKHRRL